MANYNPTINVNMTTPQPLPDVPVLHSAETSWGDIADALQGVGDFLQMTGRQKANKDEDAAKQLKLQTGNQFAREMQKLVARREQTGNQVAFEQSKRALMDQYLSQNIVSATDLSKIAGDYDEGYLKLGESSRERWSKYDDESQQKIVAEMKSKYTYLNNVKDSDVLSYVNRINTAQDFGNTLQLQMNAVDPVKYPEEYNRLKERRDAFYTQNVVGQTLLAIQQATAADDKLFTDPVQTVQFEQQQVAHLIRQGVAQAEAAVIVHQAMTSAGAYQPWTEIKQQMGASQQFMQDMLKYKQSEVDYALNQSVPQLMTAASLKTAMGDNWTSFAVSPSGTALKDTISVGVEQFVKGNIEGIKGLPADQQQTGVDTLKVTLASSAPTAVKGVMMAMTGKGVAGDGIKGKTGNDAIVVLKNAEGMNQIFQSPYSQIVKRSLLGSPTASQQGLGIELQNTEDKVKALVDINTFVNSPIKGARDLRYFLERTTMSDNLRVDGSGKLVYVAGTGLLEAAWEGLTAQGVDTSAMLDNINEGYAEYTKASPKELRQMWINAGISPVQAGERAMKGPSIIESIKQKFSNKPVTSTSTIRNSETITNAFLDIDPNSVAGQALVWDLVEEDNTPTATEQTLSDAERKQLEKRLEEIELERDYINNNEDVKFDSDRYQALTNEAAKIRSRLEAEPVSNNNNSKDIEALEMMIERVKNSISSVSSEADIKATQEAVARAEKLLNKLRA